MSALTTTHSPGEGRVRVLVWGDGPDARLALAALKRLRIPSRLCGARELAEPLPRERVLIAGPIAGFQALHAPWAGEAPVLWSPSAAMESALRAPLAEPLPFINASRLRFASQLLTALAGVGRVRAFRAVVSAPPPPGAQDPGFWARSGVGVLEDLGADLLDVLAWRLPGLNVARCWDDARGGVAAEAHVRLQARDGVDGRLELSWLRDRGAWLEVTGDAGEARIDLPAGRPGRGEWRLQAEVGRLRAWLDGSLEAGAAARLALECMQARRPLVQPWETDVETIAGRSSLAGRRVLVVGATGFIGARLVEVLASRGAAVTAAVRKSERAARIARHPIVVAEVELSASGSLDAVVSGQEVVFNLAYDLDRSVGENLTAHAALADAAGRAGVRRFVHTSSIAVYDSWPRGDLHEDSPADAQGHDYKTAKRAIERDLEQRANAGQFTAAILQPTIVYGPFSALWTDRYATWMHEAAVVLPSDGAGRCNGVYVDDVVQAMVLAATAPIAKVERFIVSGPVPFAWRELLGGYADELGASLVCEAPVAELGPELQAAGPAHPSALSRLAAHAVRVARRNLNERLGPRQIAALQRLLRRPKAGAFRPADAEPDLFQAQGECSIGKARRVLGYAPAFGVEEGLAATRRYLAWRFGRSGAR